MTDPSLKPDNSQGVDHVIILVNDLDLANKYIEALGFTVTPRAEHKIFGTANHLVILKNIYIELLGIVNDDPEDPTSINHIKGLLDKGEGLHIIALSTDDINNEHTHLKSLSPNTPDPQFWSRAVPAKGIDELASFTTMFLPSDIITPRQMFYCQQHTPHLVWREEWMSHQNQAQRVTKISFPQQNPLANIDEYKKLFSEDTIKTSGNNFSFLFKNIELEFIDEKIFEYRSMAAVVTLETKRNKNTQVTSNTMFVFEKEKSI